MELLRNLLEIKSRYVTSIRMPTSYVTIANTPALAIYC